MITGGSYNVFNAEEHLLHSLLAMRPNLDYINIVVQFVSNQGERASPELEGIIAEVKALGLVDEIIYYTPDLTAPPALNELAKRNIGLRKAIRAGVDHFITLDCDEYYVEEEFCRAKQLIESEGFKSTAVATYLHVKRPIYRSARPDVTCCSFLTEIDATSEIVYGAEYPALVDPTRVLHGERENFHMLPVEIVSMRHMNLVRLDIDNKLRNSSNAAMVDFMISVRKAYAEWKPGDILRFPNKEPMEIIQVPDLFKIDHLFSNS